MQIGQFTRNIQFGTIVMVLLLSSGCDTGGLPLVPVSGRLTYGGGDWPAPGYVTFVPTAAADGLPMRPGTGRFRQDGKFVVTSFKEGDGLLPGTYEVQVKCWTGEPNSSDATSFERLNAVPKNYRPEDVVVEAGAEEVDLQIDVPKK